jgi:hypothetical protein
VLNGLVRGAGQLPGQQGRLSGQEEQMPDQQGQLQLQPSLRHDQSGKPFARSAGSHNRLYFTAVLLLLLTAVSISIYYRRK